MTFQLQKKNLVHDIRKRSVQVVKRFTWIKVLKNQRTHFITWERTPLIVCRNCGRSICLIFYVKDVLFSSGDLPFILLSLCVCVPFWIKIAFMYVCSSEACDSGAPHIPLPCIINEKSIFYANEIVSIIWGEARREILLFWFTETFFFCFLKVSWPCSTLLLHGTWHTRTQALVQIFSACAPAVRCSAQPCRLPSSLLSPSTANPHPSRSSAADVSPSCSSRAGKSLAAVRLCATSWIQRPRSHPPKPR